MRNAFDGILLVDKNRGDSSFEVVSKIRKILKVKKAGHAGTLDPFATGLLVVLMGQGTKLSPYLMSVEKRYLATVRLGVETDTLDPTGRVTRTMPVPHLSPEFIQEKAEGLIGEIEQVPPMFSAIRHNGTRAYVLARNGISFDLQKRRVKILDLKILSVDLPDVTLVLECSKGAYVRSIAAEMGRRLGTGAHLRVLRRISSGPFEVGNAVKVEGIAGQDHAISDRIISLRHALPHMPEAEVPELMAQNIRRGIRPEWDAIAGLAELGESFCGYVKLINGMELVAIIRVYRSSDEKERCFDLMRVFT